MFALPALDANSVASYLIALLLPALDGIFPILPSEAIVVALGVATAGSTDARIVLLVALAAAGAWIGDNVSYLIGRHFGPGVQRRFLSTGKAAERRVWAERGLQRYGLVLIVVCRFIPGGRIAVTFTCGLIGYQRGRFMLATAVASSIWATYAFLAGRVGGHAFSDRPWAGLVLALVVVLGVSVVIELARRSWRWQRSRTRRRQPA